MIVIEENHSYDQILGSGRNDAPYISQLATQGVNFTNSHAEHHPSQPNYLELFSGSAQGVTDDSRPGKLPFNTPNLGAELRAGNAVGERFTFIGYSESMPGEFGFDGDAYSTVHGQGQYVRKHNPWVNWQSDDAPANNHLQASVNKAFESWSISVDRSFSELPTVSFVIPNEVNDMHDGMTGTDPERITTADTWLKDHLDAYIQWARTHNSLFILTWDENDPETAQADTNRPVPEQNQIPTIMVGSRLKPGTTDNERITHHNVLRTIEDMYGLAHAGNTANVLPITSPFLR
ncbi:MAG: acid phosphatase [Verrucomicrobia bacterium]|nr:acid phosphatase [Verrucomicrobiota bacterium]